MSEPVLQEPAVKLRPVGDPAPAPFSLAKIALATGGGVLALAVLGGAAIALFNVALTTVTLLAFGVALVAVVVLFPEVPFDEKKFTARVDKLVKEHGYCTVIVSERVWTTFSLPMCRSTITTRPPTSSL